MQASRALSALAEHCSPQLAPCTQAMVSLYRTVLQGGACSSMAERRAGEAEPPRSMTEDDVHMVREGGGGGEIMCEYGGKVAGTENRESVGKRD